VSSSDGFLAVSPASLAVVERARRAAEHGEPVLVTGETGTGKELIAKVVHNGQGPLVVIDCTHLTEELATRELYGNERGAYTGADKKRPGAFHVANGGVVFFDEIGELPLPIQAKLLRVIQEKSFTPLGSTQACRTNFRVIAATNRDLKAEVAQKRFREDLFYRLSVLKIHIPPLRERPEDLRLLITHFAHKHHLHLKSEAVDVLMRYGWPGNVRQLENTIRGIAIEKKNQIADVPDLPLTVTSCSPLEGSATLSRQAFASEEDWNDESPRTISEVERIAIINSLIANGGRRNKVAAELSLSRATLYRRLDEMRKDSRFCSMLASALGRRGSKKDKPNAVMPE
jgi:transcriptional regulator with PAS, ATPase and Fis domain